MSVGDAITCECNNCVDEEIKTVSARHARRADIYEPDHRHRLLLRTTLAQPDRITVACILRMRSCTSLDRAGLRSR